MKRNILTSMGIGLASLLVIWHLNMYSLNSEKSNNYNSDLESPNKFAANSITSNRLSSSDLVDLVLRTLPPDFDDYCEDLFTSGVLRISPSPRNMLKGVQN